MRRDNNLSPHWPERCPAARLNEAGGTTCFVSQLHSGIARAACRSPSALHPFLLPGTLWVGEKVRLRGAEATTNVTEHAKRNTNGYATPEMEYGTLLDTDLDWNGLGRGVKLWDRAGGPAESRGKSLRMGAAHAIACAGPPARTGWECLYHRDVRKQVRAPRHPTEDVQGMGPARGRQAPQTHGRSQRPGLVHGQMVVVMPLGSGTFRVAGRLTAAPTPVK